MPEPTEGTQTEGEGPDPGRWPRRGLAFLSRVCTTGPSQQRWLLDALNVQRPLFPAGFKLRVESAIWP